MFELKIAVILVSTRPNQNDKAVADWMLEKAVDRTTAEYQLIDLMEYPLPFFGESLPPSLRRCTYEYTKAWAVTIGAYDAFILSLRSATTPSRCAHMNAIDCLYAEWNDKAAGSSAMARRAG